jgi:hypothetical protein
MGPTCVLLCGKIQEKCAGMLLLVAGMLLLVAGMLLLVAHVAVKITGCNKLIFECKPHKLSFEFANR